MDEKFQTALEELRKVSETSAAFIGVISPSRVDIVSKGRRCRFVPKDPAPPPPPPAFQVLTPALRIPIPAGYRPRIKKPGLRPPRSIPTARVDMYTRFKLGTLTETLTALLINGLVNKGALDWEAPVTRYLPELGAPVVITREQEIANRLTFAPMSGRRPKQNLTYWDRHSVRDLILNKCHRLPPTEAGHGLHGLPVVRHRRELITTIKHFTKTEWPVFSFERPASEKTAFTYALLGLIVKRIVRRHRSPTGKRKGKGKGKAKGKARARAQKRGPGDRWRRLLRRSVTRPQMPTGTTARTARVQKSGNFVLPRRAVSAKGPRPTYVEWARWATKGRDVFAPAAGLYSNGHDMLNLAGWLLDTIDHRGREMRAMFARDHIAPPETTRAGALESRCLGWALESGRLWSGPGRDDASTGGGSDAGAGKHFLFRANSNGGDHTASVTIVPDFNIAVVVLATTATGVDFATHATHLVLMAISPLTRPLNICALVKEERDRKKRWYRERMLAPWIRARHLGNFFKALMPMTRDKLSRLVGEMVGVYRNTSLQRYITLSAHPAQMVHQPGGPWGPTMTTGDDLTGADACHTADLPPTGRALEIFGRMCQLMMVSGHDHRHQALTLLPHHAEYTTQHGIRTEWWSFLPRTEKEFFAHGCGHLRTMEQSLVRVEKVEGSDWVSAITVDIGGRAVRFDKMLPFDADDNGGWDRSCEVRRDWQRLEPLVGRTKAVPAI